MAGKITRHIPNAVTCCNLLSGCVATAFALQGDYRPALLFIVLGATFDFFDGLTARLLHVSSPVGKELDSLADVVTFGVAPSAMVFSLLQTLTTNAVLPYAAFLLAAFSALRLARFNLDERQTTSFIGLPTPANALFWSSLTCTVTPGFPYLLVLLLGLILLFSWLLVSPIPMFSLKFKNARWKDNRVRYVFLLGCCIPLNFLGIGGIAVIIGWYIILSLITQRREPKPTA